MSILETSRESERLRVFRQIFPSPCEIENQSPSTISRNSSTQATIHPLAIILTAALWALVSMNRLGEYCGLNTASSVFLILLSFILHNKR